MTFSLVARCKETGMLEQLLHLHLQQLLLDVLYKSKCWSCLNPKCNRSIIRKKSLDFLETGLSSSQVIEKIKSTNQHLEYRQVLIIDSNGQTAIHSGNNSLGIWSEAIGDNIISAGNLLANKEVTKSIVSVFEKTKGHLADRMLAGLKGGLDAGGEAGPIHSAGIKISHQVSWPIIDLRCDWTEECPITKLSEIWKIYKPQVNDYLQRGLDPTKAPSYGVPGDE